MDSFPERPQLSEPTFLAGKYMNHQRLLSKLMSNIQASNEDHELASELFDKLPTWLESGQIKPNPTKVYDGGLKAIPEGFQEYRDGKVSGYKIVYKL